MNSQRYPSSRRNQPPSRDQQVIEFAKLTPSELALPYRLLGDERRGWRLLDERTGQTQDVGNDWDSAVRRLREANARKTG